MAGDGEGFWQFSCDLYARQGVEEALLALQDEDGLDVPILLFCIYAAARGVALSDGLQAEMTVIGKAWGEEVIAPLRAARRGLKRVAPESALRTEVKRLELDAEQAMHVALEALLPANGAAAGEARMLAQENLASWLASRNLAVTEGRRSCFAVLIAQAFP